MKVIRVPLTNRKAGMINANNEFITHRTEQSFFIAFNGFGISGSVLALLKKNNVKKILIVYDKDGKKHFYKCTVEDYYIFGQEYSYGSDYQLVLNINRMKEVG